MSVDIPNKLLSRWKSIAATAIFFWSSFSLLILSMPQSHRAQALVAPAETTGIAASTLLAPFPSLPTSFLDPKPTGNFAVYLGALRTRETADAIRRETELLATLEMEMHSSKIRRPRSILGRSTNSYGSDEILEWLERNTSATPQPNSILWTIEVRHPDPDLALAVLRTLHATAEARVRDEISAMVSRRIAWLTDRISAEQDQSVRNVLYELVGQAHRHAAILASDHAVAARIISAPAVDQHPTVPNLTFLVALALLASMLLSISSWTLRIVLADPEKGTPFRTKYSSASFP